LPSPAHRSRESGNVPAGATLQISLAPSDLDHVHEVLPHQLRVWAGQVDEILCVLDLKRSWGRFGQGRGGEVALREAVDSACAAYPHARSVVVDYGRRSRRHLARAFFGRRSIPAKDFRGGPFYSYFFALGAASHDFVFHADSDMLFGGGSQSWIADAIQLLNERPDVLICSPFPGPPTADGRLRQQSATIEPMRFPALSFEHVTTRVFFLNRRSLLALAPLPRRKKFHGRRNRLRAFVRRTSVYDLPERLLSDALKKHGLKRLNVLGQSPGMWALHPEDRSPLLLRQLPELVRRVETGDVPEEQRGYYDVQESMLT
jgi:hypothetical protein